MTPLVLCPYLTDAMQACAHRKRLSLCTNILKQLSTLQLTCKILGTVHHSEEHKAVYTYQVKPFNDRYICGLHFLPLHNTRSQFVTSRNLLRNYHHSNHGVTVSHGQRACTQGPHFTRITKPPLNLPLKMAEWQ